MTVMSHLRKPHNNVTLPPGSGAKPDGLLKHRIKRANDTQGASLHPGRTAEPAARTRPGSAPRPGRAGAVLAFPASHSVPSAQGVCCVRQPLRAPSTLLHQSRRHCICSFQRKDSLVTT